MKQALVAVLVVAGCTAPPWQQQQQPPAKPKWQALHGGEDFPGAVLGAWGPAGGPMYFVGGALDNGQDALVLRWDGAHLKRLGAGGKDTLWWATGTSSSDMWFVGEHGRLTHFDGEHFAESPPVVDATLFGAMALSRTEVWAVGGKPGAGGPDDVILHFDGSAWRQETLPGNPRDAALLKIWGSSSDNLYVVGERGLIWHKDPTGWHAQSDDYTPPLVVGTINSVHGCGATEIYAVSGLNLLHSDGTRWEKMAAASETETQGVSCGPNGMVVVGIGGLKLRIKDGTITDDSEREPFLNLHAPFSEADGTIWAVGGDYFSAAQAGAAREGVIGRFGVGPANVDIEP